MRKQKPQSNTISYLDDQHTIIISNANHHYFENTSAILHVDAHKSPGNLTLPISAIFTSCTRTECGANNALSIYVDPCPTELEFHSCKFLSCPAIAHTTEVQSIPARQALYLFIVHISTIAKRDLEADLMMIDILPIRSIYLHKLFLHILILSALLLRTTAKA